MLVNKTPRVRMLKTIVTDGQITGATVTVRGDIGTTDMPGSGASR